MTTSSNPPNSVTPDQTSGMWG
ncbi:hypothetical protein, partial [Acinetobacter baumannii]